MVSKRRTAAEVDPGPELARAVEAADQAQRVFLEGAMLRQEAREAAQRVERARLAARHGPEDPRTRLAVARLDAQAARRDGLRVELARLELPEPEPSPDACIFYGRVTDAKGLGLEALTVVALGAKKDELAKSETDETGYFSLRVPTPQPTEVRLNVYGKNQRPLYSDEDARLATPGDIFYDELTVEPVKKADSK